MNSTPDAAEVVRRLGGCAPRAAILRFTTVHALRAAVLSGALQRTARGTYALPGAPAPWKAASAMRGLVSHESAAAHWLMESLIPASSSHVLVPRHARRQSRRGVTLHYGDVAPTDDHDGVTSPLRTVLDCAGTMPFTEALAIADSALRRELLTTEDLIQAALRRRGAGRRRAFRVATNADARSANPFESALRGIALDAGVTGFQPQVAVHTAGGIARVDLGDEWRRIALEADSFTFHGTRDALERDCRRYDELVRQGWLVLRFAWEHVLFDSTWVAAVIAETCAMSFVRPTGRSLPDGLSRAKYGTSAGPSCGSSR